MIIVSQDKDTIVNFENIVSIWIDNNPFDNSDGKIEIIADADGTNETLGFYETEERAKEVLQTIIDFYRMKNQTAESFERAILRVSIHQYEVFKMPEK